MDKLQDYVSGAIRQQRTAPGKMARMLSAGFLCVSATLLGLATAHAAPISFSLMTASGVNGCPKKCPVVVAAQGEIDNTSASRFEALVRNHLGKKPKGLTVLLHSGGGYVIAAANLGKVFRKYGATVVVARVWNTDVNTMLIRMYSGKCVSACVYAFMGGAKRVVPDGSSLVLHRSYASRGWFQSREYNNDIVQQYILDHAKAMGVSTDAIVFAERLDPSHLYPITPEQMQQWKLARRHF